MQCHRVWQQNMANEVEGQAEFTKSRKDDGKMDVWRYSEE